MRINSNKNEKGQEVVWLRISTLPEFQQVKERQLLKLKLDEGTVDEEPKIYLIMKQHYFQTEIQINPETSDKCIKQLNIGNLVKIVLIDDKSHELNFRIQEARGRNVIILSTKPEIYIPPKV